jgi:hypothetical protein
MRWLLESAKQRKPDTSLISYPSINESGGNRRNEFGTYSKLLDCGIFTPGSKKGLGVKTPCSRTDQITPSGAGWRETSAEPALRELARLLGRAAAKEGISAAQSENAQLRLRTGESPKGSHHGSR